MRRPSPLGTLVALLSLLAALDLARAYAGTADPSASGWTSRDLWIASQVVAVFAAVACLAWLLRERGRPWREALPVLALAAFLIPTYLHHSRNLESDGVNYYAYLRSLLFDGDLDLVNDFALLGAPYTPNPHPVGASVVWAPFVLVVHLVWQVARLFGAPASQGIEPIYQGAACLATLIYGAAGLFLLQDTLRRWVSPAAALWTTVICWVGSPLRFYLSVLPGFSHGAEFLAAVLVVRTYLALRERPEAKRAAACGLACGFAFLTRSQDGVLLALPGVELFRLFVRRDGARDLRPAVALAAAFFLAALPQLAVWQAMFGTPVLIPYKLLHGDAFLHLAEPQLAGTLFSPRGGLFVNYPAMLVAFVGLLALVFRDGRYVAGAMPALLLGWYVNSTIFDWYQVRRFTGLVPLLAPGLARALQPVTRAGVAAMATVAFLVLRYDLAVDGLRSQPGQPVPVRAALAEVGDGLAGDAYRLLEGRAPRAAVSLLAAYTGERLLDEPVSHIDLAGEPGVLRLPQRARGFSEPAVEDGVACRWVRDQEARLFLPLAWQGEVIVTVRARPLETVEPQAMTLVWNGVIAERHVMVASAWVEYRFHVPVGVVRAGTNVMVLQFARAPIYRRVRGEGPREVRPAALSSLTLHRGAPRPFP